MVTRTAALAFVLAAAGLVLASCGSQEADRPPEQVLEGFLSDLAAGDGEAACAAVTNDSEEEMVREMPAFLGFHLGAATAEPALSSETACEPLVSCAPGLFAALGAIDRLTEIPDLIEVASVEGDHQQAVVILDGLVGDQREVHLIEDGGRWRIDSWGWLDRGLRSPIPRDPDFPSCDTIARGLR